MKIALYKGPATGFWNTLGHWLVCIGTWSLYSHVELVIDGVCWSSTARDGGVRGKVIDLTSGKWDVIDVTGDQAKALAWFQAHAGQHYDWWGIVRFVLPLVKQRPGEFFCSESVAAALGLDHPEDTTPQDLFKHFGEK